MSQLKELAKRIYKKVKTQPWRTLRRLDYTNDPQIGSLPLIVNGQECELRITNYQRSFFSLRLEVMVLVDSRTHYPGGVYNRWWPWAWERRVFNRVIQKSYDTLIIPCDSVQEGLVDALGPPVTGGELSVSDKQEA